MIVSWDWIRQYVKPTADVAEVTRRLAMSGLNHEETKQVGGDLAINLEVTSNRPDCLGHLGVAREIAALFGSELIVPSLDLKETSAKVQDVTRVRIDCPALCPRYTARVIRGIRVRPSPDWMVRRLATVGIKAINNVVDITNYVMLECGQPLHAFDFDRLEGQEIIVREARAGEQIVAIDHKTYPLSPGMVTIADAKRAVGLGGVMGGLDTEVSDTTSNLLIEAAEFAPVSIRDTARSLKLHSPSSYRFERAIDPMVVDWASRRCCQLILELAGGELCAGVLDVGTAPREREPIRLRFAQLSRILGIDIPKGHIVRILNSLGFRLIAEEELGVTVIPPSWRRDVFREIDIVEEAARIHGYEEIPEDVQVPMSPSHRSDADRVLVQTRQVLTAQGFDEAVTVSAVSEEWSLAFDAWSQVESLRCATPIVKGADRLRRSLLPSLLGVRAVNEAVGNETIELFETARIYLTQPAGLPRERRVVALTSGRDFYFVKGTIESLLDSLHVSQRCQMEILKSDFFAAGKACRLQLGDDVLGFLGITSQKTNRLFGLRQPAVVAELDLELLERHARLVPQHASIAAFPAISQDLNVIVSEPLQWADLLRTVQNSGGEWLEEIAYRETYRDPKTDGPGKKRLLFSITLRSASGTLTTDQANDVREKIVSAVAAEHGGKLLA